MEITETVTGVSILHVDTYYETYNSTMNKHIEGTNNETIIGTKNINISGDLSGTVSVLMDIN